jgi:hypothetical protein
MVVLRREGAWPGGRRLRIPVHRLARLGTPVLVVSAALCGAAVSAAVLVGFWGKEADGRKTAEAKLAASVKREHVLERANTRLQRRLTASHSAAVQLERTATHMRASAEALVRENTALVASANKLHDQGGSLEQRAADVSKLAGTLGNDLVAVLGYITNTSAGSLDPSYLKAQLDYLRPAVASVRSAAEALGADAGSYGSAIEGFTAQVGDYAAALQRLGNSPTRR